MHLSTWVWGVCASIASVVVYPIPPMFWGVVHDWFAMLSLSVHTVLYPCRQYRSNLSKPHPWCVTKYRNFPTVFDTKTSPDCLGPRGWPWIVSLVRRVLSMTRSMTAFILPFGVAQKPRYLTASVSGVTSKGMLLYSTRTGTFLSDVILSTIISFVFSVFTGIPLQVSNSWMTFIKYSTWQYRPDNARVHWWRERKGGGREHCLEPRSCWMWFSRCPCPNGATGPLCVRIAIWASQYLGYCTFPGWPIAMIVSSSWGRFWSRCLLSETVALGAESSYLDRITCRRWCLYSCSVENLLRLAWEWPCAQPSPWASR